MIDKAKSDTDEAPQPDKALIQLDPRAPDIADKLLAFGKTMDPDLTITAEARLMLASAVTAALGVLDIILPIVVQGVVDQYAIANNPLRGPEAANEDKAA